jgi:DNA-binding MarR family transcriptional regulator
MISTGGMTFRVDGLESEGLLRRVRDPNDRRVVYAELTPKGLEVIDEAITEHVAMLNRLLQSLSQESKDLLATLLTDLEESIRQVLDEEDSLR